MKSTPKYCRQGFYPRISFGKDNPLLCNLSKNESGLKPEKGQFPVCCKVSWQRIWKNLPRRTIFRPEIYRNKEQSHKSAHNRNTDTLPCFRKKHSEKKEKI